MERDEVRRGAVTNPDGETGSPTGYSRKGEIRQKGAGVEAPATPIGGSLGSGSVADP
jgi:hypothetical protein